MTAIGTTLTGTSSNASDTEASWMCVKDTAPNLQPTITHYTTTAATVTDVFWTQPTMVSTRSTWDRIEVRGATGGSAATAYNFAVATGLTGGACGAAITSSVSSVLTCAGTTSSATVV